MSGVPICLHISGDHVALESLADSIDKQALSAIRSRVGALRANEVNFEPSWSGKAADAFVSCCLELGNDFDNQISVYLDNAGEVIRAYAWRIRRGKELFDDYGETAVNAGLIKQGDYVLPPTSRRAGDRSGPCSVTDVDPDQLHVPSPFTLFDEISERVQQWHREHSIWILTYFEQLIKRAEKATELSKLLSAFEVDESTIVGLALEGSNHGVTK